MIGTLPKNLNVNGVERAIQTDFRVALLIFQAVNDIELSQCEKSKVILECLYEDFEGIPFEDYEEAYERAIWFLDGGPLYKGSTKNKQEKKTMDWEQDEQILFSAINKIAGYETRAQEYIHWWTFLGFFFEIEEGLFTNVLSIRIKKNKGKKLEQYEKEFYQNNKELIDLKTKYTQDEQSEIDYFNNLLK